MSGKYSVGKGRRLAVDIAVQAMRLLFIEAVKAVREGDWERARRLVRQADEIRRVLRIRKPRFLRRAVCKNCGIPLVPGLTARYRLVSDGSTTRLVVTCLACGYIHRYVLAVGRGRKRHGEGEAGKA
jgi:ribonuclease P protein subunit RPR2